MIEELVQGEHYPLEELAQGEHYPIIDIIMNLEFSGRYLKKSLDSKEAKILHLYKDMHNNRVYVMEKMYEEYKVLTIYKIVMDN